MRTVDYIQDGLRNLLRHKLRSALTMLGIVFGIAAVIAMLGIGAGAQATVLKQISGLGLRNIIIDSVPPTQRANQSGDASRRVRLNFGVTNRDAAQIEAVLPGARVLRVHIIRERITLGSQRINGVVAGVPREFYGVMNARLVRGEFHGEMHDEQRMNVALVNERLLESAPQLRQGIDEILKIGQKYFQIIGVVDIPAHQEEARVYLPYGTSMSAFGTTTMSSDAGTFNFSSTEVGQLVVHAASEEAVPGTLGVVEHILATNHRVDDYRISVPLHVLKGKQATQRILNLVLITIAGISLLVGGIGIMNIMLASVTERIPEIGIRRAIGATRGDIMRQFLVETATLTFLGGMIGCALGAAAVPLAGRWTGWAGIISMPAILVSLAVAVVVGIVFGMAPAIRAARLDPGAALRHEV